MKKYKSFGVGLDRLTDSFVWWLSRNGFEMPYAKWGGKHALSWKWKESSSGAVAVLHPTEDPETELLVAPVLSQVSMTANPHYLIGNAKKGRDIEIVLIEIDSLTPVKRGAYKRTNDGGTFTAETGIIARIILKSGLREGTYALKKVDPRWKAVGEHMFFDDISKEGPMANLYIVDFISEQLFVVSQKWYEKCKNYDEGYTYLIQAIRDPLTGEIIGRGSRLGLFTLSADGKKFKEWSSEDGEYLVT